MSNLAKKAIGGSIHKIREFELEKVNLAEEFDILQIVGEGWFGKILLVEHKATDTEMVLKALPKPYSALRDFYREFHYSLHLGAHRNIITTYDVAFETAGFFVFSQEYAPLGDLTSNVTETGIGELHSKRVAKQLAAALEHLHVRDLVHRDVKLDNILVFKSDFSRIKLCDFGETRKAGTLVRRQNEWLPYAPPEVLLISNDDTYKTETIHDVWQFGIVIFVCLTGCLPWQKAGEGDPRWARYLSWHTSTLKLRHRQPKLFRLVSSRAQRLFRKFLEPKPDKRPATLSDVHKYLDERWMAKNSSDKNTGQTEVDDGLCPSMYSFHSSPEEKSKLLHSLTQYGIETTVDRGAKKDRIRAWIENSIITEEEEDTNGQEIDTDEEERVGILDNETGPPGERMDRGPIQSKTPKIAGKTTDDKQKRREILNDMINKRNSAIYRPPVDPRIPLEQQRRAQSEVQINTIIQEHPVAYFHKFASKIAQDLPQDTPKETKPTVQKTQMSTQTSLSNGSNNSVANSDDSTKVNFKNNPIPEDPRNKTPPRRESSTTRGSLKQKNGFNSSLEEDPPRKNSNQESTRKDSLPKRDSVPRNSSQKSQKKVLDTPSQKTTVYVNGHDSSRRIPSSGQKLQQNKYTGKYQMKNRYDIYEMKESSSSISNSTGRSVSK